MDINIVEIILNQLKNCQFKDFVYNNFDNKFSWEIKGTSVLSGYYDCKDTFMNEVIGRISSKIDGQWTMDIHNYYITEDSLIGPYLRNLLSDAKPDFKLS